MNVKRSVRKQSVLYSLYHRRSRLEGGELQEFKATAYTIAGWQSIPQSNAWRILQELCRSHFVNRHKRSGKSVVITYALTKLGRNHVDKHFLECLAASLTISNWKLEKYKRSLSA